MIFEKDGNAQLKQCKMMLQLRDTLDNLQLPLLFRFQLTQQPMKSMMMKRMTISMMPMHHHHQVFELNYVWIF